LVRVPIKGISKNSSKSKKGYKLNKVKI